METNFHTYKSTDIWTAKSFDGNTLNFKSEDCREEIAIFMDKEEMKRVIEVLKEAIK